MNEMLSKMPIKRKGLLVYISHKKGQKRLNGSAVVVA